MTTPRFHFEVQQGDDRPIRVPVSTVINGQPANITGWHVRVQLRPTTVSATKLHEWSTEDGSAVTEQTSVLLLCDDSRTWTFTGGVFDVELTHPDEATTIEATGSLYVRKAVTR